MARKRTALANSVRDALMGRLGCGDTLFYLKADFSGLPKWKMAACAAISVCRERSPIS